MNPWQFETESPIFDQDFSFIFSSILLQHKSNIAALVKYHSFS